MIRLGENAKLGVGSRQQDFALLNLDGHYALHHLDVPPLEGVEVDGRLRREEGRPRVVQVERDLTHEHTVW